MPASSSSFLLKLMRGESLAPERSGREEREGGGRKEGCAHVARRMKSGRTLVCKSQKGAVLALPSPIAEMDLVS